jgi:hypothetical protein
MRTKDDHSRETHANAVDETDSSGRSRRSFLGRVGGAAAAAAVGSVVLEPLVGARPAKATEIGPAIRGPRLDAAYRSRIAGAKRMFTEGIPAHPCSGDEAPYVNRIGSYSKGLPHNSIGEVVPDAYNAMLAALASGDPADFGAIPLGGARRLTNPQAGLAFASAEAAGEEVELELVLVLDRGLAFAGRHDARPELELDLARRDDVHALRREQSPRGPARSAIRPDQIVVAIGALALADDDRRRQLPGVAGPLDFPAPCRQQLRGEGDVQEVAHRKTD